MKKNIFFLLFVIATINIFAQENIQPKWGISYCYGRVVNRPDTSFGLSPTPLSNKWKYASFEIYRNFHIKKFSLHIGGAIQHSVGYIYDITKYPTNPPMISTFEQNPFLAYLGGQYNLFPSKRVSPYLDFSIASRIKNFNSLIGEIGVNIQPIYEMPLFFCMKARFVRAFYSSQTGIFPYLDNAALGFSVQYSFKPSKNKKIQE